MMRYTKTTQLIYFFIILLGSTPLVRAQQNEHGNHNMPQEQLYQDYQPSRSQKEYKRVERKPTEAERQARIAEHAKTVQQIKEQKSQVTSGTCKSEIIQHEDYSKMLAALMGGSCKSDIEKYNALIRQENIPFDADEKVVEYK